MTPDQMAAMIDKVGVAITMLVVIIPCTMWLARLYIGAMNRMIEANSAHATQLAVMAATATQASIESASAIARNTRSNDNLSAKTEALAGEIKRMSCLYQPPKPA